MSVGLVTSCFDLLHSGHIMMLREAKTQCDYLIAALQIDPTIDRPHEKNKPIQNIVERYIQLSAIKYVDEIVCYETEKDLVDIIQMFPITVRILGQEYKEKKYTGYEETLKRNIKIYYNSRDHRFSTSELRKRVNTQGDKK